MIMLCRIGALITNRFQYHKTVAETKSISELAKKNSREKEDRERNWGKLTKSRSEKNREMKILQRKQQPRLFLNCPGKIERKADGCGVVWADEEQRDEDFAEEAAAQAFLELSG